jgi:hypothetical protein
MMPNPQPLDPPSDPEAETADLMAELRSLLPAWYRLMRRVEALRGPGGYPPRGAL